MTTSPPLFGDNKESFPVFLNHQTLNGYYQYYPDQGDTLRIDITMYKNGQQVGYGNFMQKDTVDSFTPFEAVINYNQGSTQAPDSANIKVQPNFNTAKGISRAIVDKLSFDGYVLGVRDETVSTPANAIRVYPNPVSTVVTVDLYDGSGDITITDLTGKMMIKETIKGAAKKKIDISDLTDGYYLISVKTASLTYLKKLLIIK